MSFKKNYLVQKKFIKLSSEKFKKLQREEKIQHTSRNKAQKRRNLVSDKPKLKAKKSIRLARKASKKPTTVR